MDKKMREAIRYLGYGTYAIDEQTLGMIQDSFAELDHISDVKFIYRIFEISGYDDGMVEIGSVRIQSNDLRKNLSGCKRAAFLAITLGANVDLQLKRYEITNIAKAVVFQACAAALLEEHCDMAQKQIAVRTNPRFSPGYGDFSIAHQKEILQVLDAGKTIGISLTEAGMLIPTKSVTAVIGIKKE